nr:condensation domain-containing protein [Amycolatopsis umgeniensis]
MLAELLDREDGEQEFPVASAQREMLTTAARFPDSRAAGIHLAIRLDGRVSLEGLRAAHHTLLSRHSALRTGFRADPDGWRQAVSEGGEFPMRISTGEPLDDSCVVTAFERAREEPFDLLGAGPLARAELITDRNGAQVLLWSWHHAVVDGYSLGLLWSDFTAAYRGGHEQTEPVPYGEFALWQREWLAGPEARRAAERLASASDSFGDLPPQRSRPARPDIGAMELVVPAAVHDELVREAVHRGLTTHMVLLAAYRHEVEAAGLLGAAAPVWTPLAGRTDDRFMSTVGMFGNVLPVFGRAGGDLSPIRDGCILAMECQNLPRPELLQTRPIPADALFALQNTPSGDGSLPGVRVSVVRPPGVPPVAPILEFYSPPDELFRTALSFGYRDGGLTGVFEYDRAEVPDSAATAVVAGIGKWLRSFTGGAR